MTSMKREMDSIWSQRVGDEEEEEFILPIDIQDMDQNETEMSKAFLQTNSSDICPQQEYKQTDNVNQLVTYSLSLYSKVKPLIDGQNETIVDNEVNGTEIVLNNVFSLKQINEQIVFTQNKTQEILRQNEENKIKNRKYRADIKQQINHFERERDPKRRDQINDKNKRQKIKYFQRYRLKRVKEGNDCKQFGKSNKKCDKQSKSKTQNTIKCRKTQSTQTVLTAEDVINLAKKLNLI